MSKNDTSRPDNLTQHRAFFGRVSGKRLHAGQKLLFESLLPDLQIELPADGRVSLKQIFDENADRRVLEIGYGGGEHLVRLANQSPQNSYVGCEVFTGGIGKILKSIDQQKLKNVKLFTQDAYRLLKALPNACLHDIYLLYPDPWPKSRHNKRRFVSNTTLSELARVLRPGGKFRFATDIQDYANWTLAHMVRNLDFSWHTRTEPEFWHTPFAGWQATRYETKARLEGRTRSYYFTFERRP